MTFAPHPVPENRHVIEANTGSIDPDAADGWSGARTNRKNQLIAPLAKGSQNAANYKRTFWKVLYKLNVVGILLVAMVTAFFYYIAWSVACNETYAIEYEGHVLWACLKLSQGQNIYDAAALVSQPWSVIIYNPLYFLIGAGLLKMTGLSFAPLRGLSMLSTLLSFLGFLILLRRSKLNQFQSIIGLILFATCLPVIHWSPVARVDMLGLCLAIGGMERFVAAFINAKWKDVKFSSMLPSLLLFLLAFFTKQQYIVFPLSCFAFLLLQRQFRIGFQFTGLYLATSLAVASVIQLATGGYWAHLMYAKGLPWEWSTLKSFIVPFLLEPKTIAALLVIGCGSILSKRRTRQEDLAGLLLAISFVVVLYSMGLRAAYHNHLLCTEMALFWLAAINLKKLGHRSPLPAIVVVAAFLGLITCLEFMSLLCWRISTNQNTAQVLAHLNHFQMRGKPILTEDPALALFVGAVPVMIDATTILNMARAEPKRLSSLLSDIEHTKYAAIIIDSKDANLGRARIWPKAVVDTTWQKYKLIGTTGGNGTKQSVFLPVKTEDSPSPAN